MMKRMLNIVASAILTTFLVAFVLSISYYQWYKPLKQQLPTKAQIKQVSDELAESRKAYAAIQEELDRHHLQESLRETPILVNNPPDELTKLQSEMQKLKELKKEVARLESIKKRVQTLAKEKN